MDPSTPSGGAHPAATVLQPGRILLGRFAVERQIGEGGMGAVYLARHTALEMSVAIKVLREPLASESPEHSLRRFANEARALARIGSEYVCRPLDFGTLETGEPYLVLEYVQGMSLTDYAERHRPSLGESLDLAIQCAAGLAEAHRIGLVHRDVKPSNVIVTMRGRRPTAKLLDFGLSKTVGLTNSITTGGRIVGTPKFMSPEQIRGGAIDHRTDVWSLGVMVFWLLSGRYPFEGPVPAVLASILDQPAASLGSIRPDVPAAVAAAIDACLEKNPVDRMPWMGAFAARLAPHASIAGKLAAELAEATQSSAVATNETPMRDAALAALDNTARAAARPAATLEFTTPKRRR